VLAPMIGNVVTSEVDSVTDVVLSEVEKHGRCGELVITTVCLTLYPRCRTTDVVITEFNCIWTVYGKEYQVSSPSQNRCLSIERQVIHRAESELVLERKIPILAGTHMQVRSPYRPSYHREYSNQNIVIPIKKSRLIFVIKCVSFPYLYLYKKFDFYLTIILSHSSGG
jgi:hypothetical protein